MKVVVVNKKGEKVKDLELPKSFDAEVSKEAVTLYVNYLRNALREPIANAKDRSEVSGGGKKPWKQKGTGRARHGSTRSPLWVGGGVTFGPSSERNFRQRINKNLKKKVILGIIAEAIKEKRAIVIDNLEMEKPKTKDAVEILNNVGAEGKIALIFDSKDVNAEKSFGNIAGVRLSMPNKLDIINIMSSNKVIASFQSMNKIMGLFAK